MAKRKKRRERGVRGEGSKTKDERRASPWRITIRYADGTSTSRYFATESEADAWHEEQKALIRAKKLPTPIPTLSAALIEYEIRHTPGAKPGSITQYQYRQTKILSLLGTDPLVTAINPTMVAGMATQMADDGLALGTIEGVISFLHGVCEDLIALGILVTNPVSAYRRIVPKRNRRGVPARKPVVLDPGHCTLLLNELEPWSYLHPFVTWLICLPFRVSELRGLRWANVQGGVISIVEQRTHARPHDPHSPKSESGIREIPITPELLALAGPRGDGLVFTNQAGGPIYDETLRTHLDKALAGLKAKGTHIPRFRVHDLRHTAASNILRLGCPLDYERALLGHAPGDITQQYARPDVETLRPHVARWIERIVKAQVDKQRKVL